MYSRTILELYYSRNPIRSITTATFVKYFQAQKLRWRGHIRKVAIRFSPFVRALTHAYERKKRQKRQAQRTGITSAKSGIAYALSLQRG